MKKARFMKVLLTLIVGAIIAVAVIMIAMNPKVEHRYNKMLTTIGFTAPHQDGVTVVMNTDRTIDAAVANYRTYYGEGEELNVIVTFTADITEVSNANLVIKFGDGAERTINSVITESSPDGYIKGDDKITFKYYIKPEDLGELTIVNLEGTVKLGDDSIQFADGSRFENTIVAKGSWSENHYSISYERDVGGENTGTSKKKIRTTTYEYTEKESESAVALTEAEISGEKEFASQNTTNMVDAEYSNNKYSKGYKYYCTKNQVTLNKYTGGAQEGQVYATLSINGWTLDDYVGLLNAETKQTWLEEKFSLESGSLTNKTVLYQYEGSMYQEPQITTTNYEITDVSFAFESSHVDKLDDKVYINYYSEYKKKEVYYERSIVSVVNEEKDSSYSITPEKLYDGTGNETTDRSSARRQVVEVESAAIIYATGTERPQSTRVKVTTYSYTSQEGEKEAMTSEELRENPNYATTMVDAEYDENGSYTAYKYYRTTKKYTMAMVENVDDENYYKIDLSRVMDKTKIETLSSAEDKKSELRRV